MTHQNLEELRDRLIAMPVEAAPSPWQRTMVATVGGLTEVGYARNSDLLLVVSAQGRGVFDCLSGERIARDREENWDGLNQTLLVSPGIGPLEGQAVRLAGLHGGGLPTTTSDGWTLEAPTLQWPNSSFFLSKPWTSVFHYQGPGNSFKIWDDGPFPLRSFGFSDTGHTFVIATSGELAIFTRVTT